MLAITTLTPLNPVLRKLKVNNPNAELLKPGVKNLDACCKPIKMNLLYLHCAELVSSLRKTQKRYIKRADVKQTLWAMLAVKYNIKLKMEYDIV